ncbi:hypothetical protein ACB092_01G095500 [Castanea dentata]
MTINSAPVKISARNVKANEKEFEPLREDNGGRCIARPLKNTNKRFCEIFPTDFWLQRIIIRNSSKLKTPSPLRSNIRIIALQSSVDLDSPSRLSILFKLVWVIQPDPSISYFPKASLSSSFLSSSPPVSISFRNSSKSSCPSPFKSEVLTAASASSIDSSPPTVVTQRCNSEGDILPSPSSSK